MTRIVDPNLSEIAAARANDLPGDPPTPDGGVSLGGAPIAILGVPLDNVTTGETIAMVEHMVASGRPHYLVTPNVDFLVQALTDVELRRILFEAHLVLCDGTPLVWASRWLGNSLAERVAGSDLVPLLAAIAAEKGYRLFFLGGSPDATGEAVAKLRARHPNLNIAGHYSPPFRPLLEMDHEEIKRRIGAAKPDVLFVCFGCPKQEKWIAMHYRSLGVPVSIGVGGTIDFLAGRLARAPLWMQRTGTEWLFRLIQEPRRLTKRYLRDCWYFGGFLAAQWCRTRLRPRRRPASSAPGQVSPAEAWEEVECPEWLDAVAVEREAKLWERALAGKVHMLLNLERVRFIDSTGVGLLIRLRKRASLADRQVVLLAPSPTVTRVLKAMRLWSFFAVAADRAEAKALVNELGRAPATTPACGLGDEFKLLWRGEITAAVAEEVWRTTEAFIASRSGGGRNHLALDLTKVTFIDSTGMGLMVRAKKRAAQDGSRLSFVGVQPDVLNVIRLSKLEAYLFNV